MRLARWLSVLVALPTLFAPNTACAWKVNTHWDETDRFVLKQSGWTNQTAINRVVDANIETDLAGGGLPGSVEWAYPNAKALRSAVLANANFMAPFNTSGTNGFHFDDLKNYTECKDRWDALWQWIKDVRTYCENQGWRPQDRDDYLVAMGMAFHAVQDFYCHANWVLRLNSLTTSADYKSFEFPTWDQLVADQGGWRTARGLTGQQMLNRMKESDTRVNQYEFNGGLQTGAYEHEWRTQVDGTWMKPWYHRHHNEGLDFSGAKIRDCEINLGTRASRDWLGWMVDLLSPANKADLLAYVTGSEPASGAPGRPLLAFSSSPVDTAIGEALDTVFVTYAGPLNPVEYVNIHFHGSGLSQAVFLEKEGGPFLYSEAVNDSTWECPSIIVHVNAESVFHWIVHAPDPYLAAQTYHSAGLFTMERTNCPVSVEFPMPSSSPAGILALMLGTLTPALFLLIRRRRPPSSS